MFYNIKGLIPQGVPQGEAKRSAAKERNLFHKLIALRVPCLTDKGFHRLLSIKLKTYTGPAVNRQHHPRNKFGGG